MHAVRSGGANKEEMGVQHAGRRIVAASDILGCPNVLDSAPITPVDRHEDSEVIAKGLSAARIPRVVLQVQGKRELKLRTNMCMDKMRICVTLEGSLQEKEPLEAGGKGQRNTFIEFNQRSPWTWIMVRTSDQIFRLVLCLVDAVELSAEVPAIATSFLRYSLFFIVYS